MEQMIAASVERVSDQLCDHRLCLGKMLTLVIERLEVLVIHQILDYIFESGPKIWPLSFCIILVLQAGIVSHDMRQRFF